MNKLLLCGLLIAPLSWGQILAPILFHRPGIVVPTLVAHTSSGALNSNTTPAINTTGATLIIVMINSVGTADVISDSKGNTYTALTPRTPAGAAKARFFYCIRPVVGAGHTVTDSASGNASAIIFAAFKGGGGVPVFRLENGNTASGASNIQPGSISPSVNDLVVGGLGVDSANAIWSAGSPTMNLVDAKTGQGGVNYGAAMFWLVSAGGSMNPSYSNGSGDSKAALIASFTMN
jgi:hypothetical protein